MSAEEKAAVEAAGRLGLFKAAERFLPKAEHEVAAAASARSPQMAAMARRVSRKGRELVGSFKWRGGSKTKGSAGWRIGEKTWWGHDNDFAKWIRGHGPPPGRSSTMNCWEATMYTAHKAGAVDKAELEQVHREAARAASEANPPGVRRTPRTDKAAKDAYYKTINDYLIPGTRSPLTLDEAGIVTRDVPEGDLIMVDGVGHVMQSLGTRDASGELQVLSHWIHPAPSPTPVWSKNMVGTLQQTTLEEVLRSGYKPGAKLTIESGTPSWLLGG